ISLDVQVDFQGTWVNEGIIEARTNGSVILLDGSWTNTGTILVTDGTLNLGGTFRTSDLGTISRTGGEINLTGTMTNNGTLALDHTTGPWIMNSGTIICGRVTTAGSANLVVGGSGNLNGITLAGALDLTPSGVSVVVTGGITLDGGMIAIGHGSIVRFNGEQT